MIMNALRSTGGNPRYQTGFQVLTFTFWLLLVLFNWGNSQAATLTTPIEQPADEVKKEVIIEDAEQGYWFYENTDTGIRIEIHRKIDEIEKILWYEADLRFTENALLQFPVANEESPGKGFAYPEVIARSTQSVFGINDDQFGHRIYNHKPVGIIIRNGKLISNKTKKNNNLSWPTLDTVAFYRDGSMRTFASQTYTGEEYLQQGAYTVLSFGPWLVREGKLNPLCEKHFTTREPRTAIGMIEPYHFVTITVEGRVKQSRGVGMQWLAERMLALHAQEAINLDGGKTTSLLFMGKRLKSNYKTGKFVKLRSVTGMITLGNSAQVPPVEALEE